MDAVDAARALVGARYRLHGRDPATGLDCVGVAAASLGCAVPGDYAVRTSDADRVRRRVSLGWEGLAIAPGDRVRVAGDATLWRVTGWTLERMAVELDLTAIVVATASAQADPGRVMGAPDLLHGRTLIVAAELPPLDDTLPVQPQLTVVAAGTGPGWRGATLLVSEDEGTSWTARAALRGGGVLGTVVSPPGRGLAAIEDRRHAIEVELAHEAMTLSGADAAAMDGGANLALVGRELIQFGLAEQIGERRWRLRRLWRGRRGTEWAMAAHAPGEPFALLRRQDVTVLPVGGIGGTVRLSASGVGDDDLSNAVTVTIDGASVLPPAPVHLAISRERRLTWVRRSRAGWAWRDGVDAPVVEEREGWRVRLPDGTSMDSATVQAVVPGGAGSVEVAQIGTFGLSRAAQIEVQE